jgi:serine carboxypeptidase-like clade 1
VDVRAALRREPPPVDATRRYEMGPFSVLLNGSATSLILRPFRWSRIVNMLFIEAPVGVGFSYSDTGDYACDDDRTARENMAAVQQFYALFPELLPNPLFIAGESYAGVYVFARPRACASNGVRRYVPTLAEAIVEAQRSGQWAGGQLAGIAVGNGCSGSEVGVCSQEENFSFFRWAYLTQTAFISSSAKASIASACNWTAAAPLPSSSCKEVLTNAAKSISHVNVYNVYGDCISGTRPASFPRVPHPHAQTRLRSEPRAIVLASSSLTTLRRLPCP